LGRLTNVLATIDLTGKSLPGKNTLAYIAPSSVRSQKFCKTTIFIKLFSSLLTPEANKLELWWNKESEILMSHLKCFSLEKHIGVCRKEATLNQATSLVIFCKINYSD